jgi:hypothetical protein
VTYDQILTNYSDITGRLFTETNFSEQYGQIHVPLNELILDGEVLHKLDSGEVMSHVGAKKWHLTKGTFEVAPNADSNASPSAAPSAEPSADPSADSSVAPSSAPSSAPSAAPSADPSASPVADSSAAPSAAPNAALSAAPSAASEIIMKKPRVGNEFLAAVPDCVEFNPCLENSGEAVYRAIHKGNFESENMYVKYAQRVKEHTFIPGKVLKVAVSRNETRVVCCIEAVNREGNVKVLDGFEEHIVALQDCLLEEEDKFMDLFLKEPSRASPSMTSSEGAEPVEVLSAPVLALISDIMSKQWSKREILEMIEAVISKSCINDPTKKNKERKDYCHSTKSRKEALSMYVWLNFELPFYSNYANLLKEVFGRADKEKANDTATTTTAITTTATTTTATTTTATTTTATTTTATTTTATATTATTTTATATTATATTENEPAETILTAGCIPERPSSKRSAEGDAGDSSNKRHKASSQGLCIGGVGGGSSGSSGKSDHARYLVQLEKEVTDFWSNDANVNCKL